MAARRWLMGRRTLLAWSLAGLGLAAAPALAQQTHPLPRRGDYLPQEVLQAGPVADYASKHLRKPPAGYGWYQLGRAFVMASVATGLIVEVVIL
jgi:Ni/Co efflux regulator RcnB